MKSLNKTLVLIASMFGFVVAAWCINHIPLKPDAGNAAPFTVNGGNPGSISGIAPIILGSKTKAQFAAYTPLAVGELWRCSDCTYDALAYSTNTVAGAISTTYAKNKGLDWTTY